MPADHPVRCIEEVFRPYVGTTINGQLPTLLATCAHDEGWFGWAEVARAIVCSSDANCERLQHVAGRPRCVEGLCQLPEEPLDLTDVLALCLASVPRPLIALAFMPSEEQLRAFELAEAACPRGGDVCEVPPECARR